uniref:NADH-ubiquinone oxidoreductase chain 6 n=1 Tax=Metrius contractus TaxID=63961 RepID=A0A343EYX0_METCO|nr:NADH dehydrogenase subunit 6 [Metrius contractus]
MYLMFLIMNLTMTITFLFMNHPLSMGLILLIQTMLVSLISGIFSYSYWFSYILFLIMLGGMLVLFIYMTSLASNEMMQFSIKIFSMILMMTMMSILTLIMIDFLTMTPLFKTSNMLDYINNNMMMKNENLIPLNMVYNPPNNLITLMLVNYLLLTLIAVVKIIDIKLGPLRQKF